TVVTIHYPLPICQRHTLMLNGKSACDGKIDIVRCSRCSDSLSKNLPNTALKTLSHIPTSVISRLKLPESAYLPSSPKNNELGSFVRPFVIPSNIASRQKNLQAMAKYADQIIVVCNWLYQSLLINGISEEKIILSRHGITYETDNMQAGKIQIDNTETQKNLDIKENNNNNQTNNQIKSLKIVFLGRWDTSKGIDILVKAIKSLPPEIKIELFIHAIAQDKAYYNRTIELIDKDPRIHIEKQLSRKELPNVLKNYHLLAVPSQWLETGPLVVLEAHTNGLPVIGSNLGGIAELVKHQENGLLVPSDDINAWSTAFKRLYFEKNLLKQLQQGIKPVRHIKEQASEIAQIYTAMLSS
ncbi:MAG: glycosyltransferase, partial [Cyanobacteria bacterium P01_A01_bin.45]